MADMRDRIADVIKQFGSDCGSGWVLYDVDPDEIANAIIDELDLEPPSTGVFVDPLTLRHSRSLADG